MNFAIAASLAAALWGFLFLISAALLPNNPVFLATVSAIIAGALLVAFGRKLPTPEFLPKLIGLGTANVGCFFLFLFIAAVRLPGAIAATLVFTAPFFAILLVWPLTKTRPNPLALFCLLAAILGFGLIVWSGPGLDPFGVIAGLLAGLSLGAGLALARKWGRAPVLSHTAATGWQLLIGALELLMFDLIIEDLPGRLTGGQALGLLFLAISLVAVPLVLWSIARTGLNASALAAFTLIVPVVALFLGYGANNYLPAPFQLLGMALVMASLAIYWWKQARQARSGI